MSNPLCWRADCGSLFISAQGKGKQMTSTKRPVRKVATTAKLAKVLNRRSAASALQNMIDKH